MDSSLERRCQRYEGKKLSSFMNYVANMLREPFQFLTTILLSLLFPLSFLILSRLSIAYYLIDLSVYPTTDQTNSLLIKFFLNTNPTFLHILISLITVAALAQSLTGCTSRFVVCTSTPISRPQLYTAWIFLCILQICVGLGIEGSIASGVVNGGDFGEKKGFLTRAIFFLGLHETMFFWSKIVVKPVVDDTIFGVVKENKWVEKASLAISFGGLWWWRLRDEVESLVIVVEKKRDLLISIGLSDFVGWWLYYLIVTIGMIKVVKGLIWVVYVMFGRRRRGVVDTNNNTIAIDDDSYRRNDDKV